MDFYTDSPLFLRNLQLHPILTDESCDFALRSIDTLIDDKKVVIEELDTPAVDEVMLDNLSDHGLLMIDGEEITGAMQNRIVTASTFIPSKTQKSLSVVCVEEGRWKSVGGFKTGDCSYPRLRSILLNKKPGTELQQDVWNEITQKLSITRVNSKTSSMHDIYKDLDDDLNRYFEGFNTLHGKAVGFIGVAGNRILGCDLFANNYIFRQFERKLVRSYALEAMEFVRRETQSPDINKFVKSLARAIKAQRTRRKKWSRFAERDIAGQTVLDKKILLHLSAFPL